MSLTRRAFATALVGGALPPAFADTWPARPVRVVVPFAAGGLTDALGRGVADLLSPGLGQPVVVENRPGAGGHVAAEAVARAPADGYQVAMLSAGHAGGAAYSQEPIRYDLLKDFAAIGMLGHSPTVLIARKALNFRTFADLVAAARAKPGQLSFGGVQSYTGEYLETMAGIRLNLVLYKGAGQALTDLLGERIDLMVGTVSDMLQHVQGGKFTAVALNSPSPVPQLPGVQPVADSIPGYRGGQWYGLFVPAKTPDAVVARLRAELAKAVQAPAYGALMTRLTMVGPDRDVAAFTAEVRATLESFQKARQLGRPAG